MVEVCEEGESESNADGASEHSEPNGDKRFSEEIDDEMGVDLPPRRHNGTDETGPNQDKEAWQDAITLCSLSNMISGQRGGSRGV